jgi:hypothetical protein
MRNLSEMQEKTSETEDTLATLCCQSGISQYFNLLPGNSQATIVTHYFQWSKVVFFPETPGSSGNSKSLFWGKA